MTRFAAKFGLTRADMVLHPDLHKELALAYAEAHGVDPRGLNEWTLLVDEHGVALFDFCVATNHRGPFDGGFHDLSKET